MNHSFGSSTFFFQKGIITSLNHGLHCSTPLQFHDITERSLLDDLIPPRSRSWPRSRSISIALTSA